MKRKVEGQGRNVSSNGSAGGGGQVRQESLTHSLTHANINLGDGEEEGRGLLSTAGVALLELLNILQRIPRKQSPTLRQLVEMPHCKLQYVSLLKLAHILSFSLKSHGHDVFQFIQTLIHARSSLPLQQRLGDLLVLVSS